jgi:protein TonB
MSAVMHDRYGADHRAFNYAVVFSIVFHALVLFGFASQRQAAKRPDPAPGPIVARLVQPSAPSAPAAATPPTTEPQVEPKAEPPPPPPVAKPVPAPATPSPIARAEPKATAKPSPVAKPQPTPPVAEVAPSAAPAPSTPAPPSAAPGPAAPASSSVARADPQPAPAAPSSDAADAGSLARYRMELLGAARKYKRYPRVAMDNNWEGTAEVAMVIGANGMITSVSIKTSAGHEILDQQALEMFKRAKPLVPIPPALRGKEFTVTLKAIYALKEPDA